jgi:hypothetical protein
MNTNGGNPDEIVTALRQGIEAGKHDSTPGNVFRSAWPAAAEHGYTGDTLLRSIFTNGYLSELPTGGVLTNAQGVTLSEKGGVYDQPAAPQEGHQTAEAEGEERTRIGNTPTTTEDELLEAAAEAQTAYWNALHDLEEATGLDIDSTQDLAWKTVADLTEN